MLATLNGNFKLNLKFASFAQLTILSFWTSGARMDQSWLTRCSCNCRVRTSRRCCCRGWRSPATRTSSQSLFPVSKRHQVLQVKKSNLSCKTCNCQSMTLNKCSYLQERHVKSSKVLHLFCLVDIKITSFKGLFIMTSCLWIEWFQNFVSVLKSIKNKKPQKGDVVKLCYY